ncbi:MAG: ABC transporter substrate-binding protein [Gemmatimonadota bacterium]
MTKRLRRLVPALAILILAGGCAGDDAAPRQRGDAEYGEPQYGGTAVIAEGADMSIPLSIVAQSALDGNLGGDVMFMSLLATDWDDGRLVYRTADESPMAIAQSYEYVGPDSASIRFHLRPDVRWSDGEPLTANDVAFTYGVLDDPELASPLQFYHDEIESVEAENDSTVVIHYSRLYPEMLTHAALQPIPEHVFGDTSPAELRNHPALREPGNGNLPVSGPFMIGSWERGTRVVLVRNPEFEPRAYLDQLVFRVIPEPLTRIVELQTGAVDFVQGVTLDQVPRLRQQAPNVRLEREEKRFYDYIAYNGGGFEPFADPEVRRALGLAIDAQGIIDALQMEEFAVVAGGPYAPIFRDLYDPEGQAPLGHDPEEAQRILEEKGWSDADNDGVLDRDGEPFSFTLVTNSGNQRRADVSQIVQEQWSRIGVRAEIQIREFNTLMENLTAGDFEATLSGWSVALSPDLTSLWSAESPFNFTRYEDPETSRLIGQARSARTYEEAAGSWREAASNIVADQPYTWLYFMDNVDGVNERLRGTKIDTYGPYQNTWEWWIPEEMR